MATLTAQQHGVLLSTPWFVALAAAIREDIVARARTIALQPQDCLFRRGDTGDGWYGLLSGSLRISGTSRQGGAAVLAFLGPGHWTGELSLLDGGPRSHDAHAHTPCTLLKVNPPDFDALLHTHPALVKQLLLKRCATTRALMSFVEAATIHPLEQRLAQCLLGLAHSFGAPMQGGLTIELHLPQELLAEWLGVSRPRISQLMGAWQKSGLIEHRYGRVVVRDSEQLQRLARQ